MIELNPSGYPLALPETLIDNACTALEKALASLLGYRHLLALDSVDAAFAAVLSTLNKNSGILCSPNAPVGLFRVLRKQELQAQFCDLKLDGTLEPRFLQKNLTAQSSALLVSHDHGRLAEREVLSRFAEANGLLLIEDATQAFGKREPIEGSLAVFDLAALLPAFIAKGGFVATNDAQLAAGLRQWAAGGYVQKRFWNYDIESLHESCTMDALKAALALNILPEIGAMQAKIAAVQALYRQKLASNRLIELPAAEGLVPHPLFPVALVPALFCPKEEIYQALTEKGIPVQVGNKPVYKTTAFKDETLSLFGAEEVYKASILLPSHPLMTLEEAAYVAETFESILKTHAYRGCSF